MAFHPSYGHCLDDQREHEREAVIDQTMARKQKKSKSDQAGRATVGVPSRGVRKSTTNSVELVAPSDKRFRSKVLASVGLDDDDDDSYDKCEDIEEAGTRRLDHKNKSENKRRRGEDKASENLELLEEEDEEDCEYDALDQSNSTSTTRCSTLKPICNNFLWILLTVAAVIYIFYDDELLEESETDEDVIQKQQPYSYNGYVDARIPTDDEAQFGGGLNDVGAALPSQDDDDEDAKEMINEFGHHHDPTGIVEVDILWEQLDGYAEISEPLDDIDLPVFWHIREYTNCYYHLPVRTYHHDFSQYVSILSQMWRNDITRHDVTLLRNDRGK